MAVSPVKLLEVVLLERVPGDFGGGGVGGGCGVGVGGVGDRRDSDRNPNSLHVGVDVAAEAVVRARAHVLGLVLDTLAREALEPVADTEVVSALQQRREVECLDVLVEIDTVVQRVDERERHSQEDATS